METRPICSVPDVAGLSSTAAEVCGSGCLTLLTLGRASLRSNKGGPWDGEESQPPQCSPGRGAQLAWGCHQFSMLVQERSPSLGVCPGYQAPKEEGIGLPLFVR